MHDEEAFELFLQFVEILEESNEPLVGDVAVTTFFVKKFSSDEMERMKGQHRAEATALIHASACWTRWLHDLTRMTLSRWRHATQRLAAQSAIPSS